MKGAKKPSGNPGGKIRAARSGRQDPGDKSRVAYPGEKIRTEAPKMVERMLATETNFFDHRRLRNLGGRAEPAQASLPALKCKRLRPVSRLEKLLLPEPPLPDARELAANGTKRKGASLRLSNLELAIAEADIPEALNHLEDSASNGKAPSADETFMEVAAPGDSEVRELQSDPKNSPLDPLENAPPTTDWAAIAFNSQIAKAGANQSAQESGSPESNSNESGSRESGSRENGRAKQSDLKSTGDAAPQPASQPIAQDPENSASPPALEEKAEALENKAAELVKEGALSEKEAAPSEKRAGEPRWLTLMKWVTRLCLSLIFLVWIFILGFFVGRGTIDENIPGLDWLTSGDETEESAPAENLEAELQPQAYPIVIEKPEQALALSSDSAALPETRSSFNSSSFPTTSLAPPQNPSSGSQTAASQAASSQAPAAASRVASSRGAGGEALGRSESNGDPAGALATGPPARSSRTGSEPSSQTNAQSISRDKPETQTAAMPKDQQPARSAAAAASGNSASAGNQARQGDAASPTSSPATSVTVVSTSTRADGRQAKEAGARESETREASSREDGAQQAGSNSPMPAADNPSDAPKPAPAANGQSASSAQAATNGQGVSSGASAPDDDSELFWPEKPSKTGQYTVQVASAISEAEARNITERYRSRGFEAYYYRTASGRFPIRVGRYPTEEQAQIAKSALSAAGANGAYVSKLKN